MSAAALALVVCAALLHASWNLLAKKAAGGAAFIWLYSAANVVLYAPVVLAMVWLTRPVWGWREAGFVLMSSALHIGYSLSLQRGYQRADLSIVYPVARGTGPLFSTLGAVLLLGERPGPFALAGACAIVGGVFVIAGGLALLRQRDARAGMGLRYGALTGLFIAAYTVCDGYAVQAVLIAPLLLDYAANVLRCAFLTPRTLRYKAELEREWRRNKWHAITIGAIAPLGYILVLTAMKTAPISAVAPMREMSMLVGAFFGAKLLGEGKVWQRVAGAGLIALGVVGIAVG